MDSERHTQMFKATVLHLPSIKPAERLDWHDLMSRYITWTGHKRLEDYVELSIMPPYMNVLTPFEYFSKMSSGNALAMAAYPSGVGCR